MHRMPRTALVLAAAMLLAGAGSACASLSISIQPPASCVALGDTFEIAVHAEGPDSVGWYWLRIVTDPDVITYLDCSTEILTHCRMGWNCMQCGPTGAPGGVEADCACFGAHTCVGVPGDLVVIRYIATGNGISPVSFEFIYVSGCDRQMLALDSIEEGSVTVGAASVETGGGTGECGVTSFSGYPNPFASGMTLQYYVGGLVDGCCTESPAIKIKVYDCQGRLVRQIGASLSPGEHRLQWDGTQDNGDLAPPGIYFCRFPVGSDVRTYKILKTR